MPDHLLFRRAAVDFSRSNDGAHPPTKASSEEIGYDLTAVSISRDFGLVTLYDTEVSICPPAGYYGKIIARSSLIKNGVHLG